MRTAHAALLFVCLHSAFAQVRRVEPTQTYERIVCVVPMIGKGTADDPRRPMFAPSIDQKVEALKAAKEGEEQLPDMGIIAYAAQETDDGQFAIVEFVARSRSAFKEILESRAPGLKVFRKEKAAKAELNSELKRLKKDFDIEKFGLAVQ